MMQSIRQSFETAILGACLLEGSAIAKVVDVLTPKNFTDATHKQIYATMQSMYPLQAIDIRTVNFAMKGQCPWYMAELTGHVSSAANLRYHAFCLLEIDLREKFAATLQPWNDIAKNTTIAGAIIEITDEVLDYGNDVFDTIEKATHYIQRIATDDELISALKAFNSNIDTKIRLIKQQAQVDSLIYQFEMLRGRDIDVRGSAALNKLTDLLKNILITGTIGHCYMTDNGLTH